MSNEAYYFGIGEIENQYPDPESNKHYYSKIKDFQPFDVPVIIRDEKGDYLEKIPESRLTNYWRDGVRAISKDIYDKILSLAGIIEIPITMDRELTSTSSISNSKEGAKKVIYSTIYERDPKLRQQALDIHGYTCRACGFNFHKTFGILGDEFIHIHHIKPLSEVGEQIVNPKTDLVPLCPNCHCMIHRNKKRTLTVEELIHIIDDNK